MKQEKVSVEYFDDLTGKPVDDADLTTVNFSVNGRNYEIDLSPESATKFERDLSRWTSKARKVSRPQRRRGDPKSAYNSRLSRRAELDKIREWAAGRGLPVSKKGRMPVLTERAYHQSHKA